MRSIVRKIVKAGAGRGLAPFWAAAVLKARQVNKLAKDADVQETEMVCFYR